MRQDNSRSSLLPGSSARRAAVLASLTAAPLLIWWLGWYPGFATSDTFDQFAQAQRFDFNDLHPAIHSLYLWLLGVVTGSPGLVTLFQVLAMAGLLSLIAVRLDALGLPLPVAVGAVWFVAALPAVGQTTIAFWKDVPYTLALLWAFGELLLMAKDPPSFMEIGSARYRLGTALGLVWVMRHNGFVTVALFLGLILVFAPVRRRLVLFVLAPLAVVVVLVQGLAYQAIPLNPVTIEPSEVFISDVAASLRWEPSNFTERELALLAEIAPLDVWSQAYNCRDSTPLAFNPSFELDEIRANAADFRSLAVRAIVRDPDTVLGHRWCAADYLFVPDQPDDAYFHRPPFEISDNAVGLYRDPISWKAYDLTRAVFVWSEPNGRLWLTWRPALVVWATVLTYMAISLRRRLRSLLIPGFLWASQLVNVALTTPAQEFRFAFGIYVLGLLSLPLLWFVVRPDDLAQTGSSRARR